MFGDELMQDGLVGNIVKLVFAPGVVDDNVLIIVELMSQLTSLYVSSNEIVDKQVRSICGLKQLTTLNIDGNQIGHKGATQKSYWW